MKLSKNDPFPQVSLRVFHEVKSNFLEYFVEEI